MEHRGHPYGWKTKKGENPDAPNWTDLFIISFKAETAPTTDIRRTAAVVIIETLEGPDGHWNKQYESQPAHGYPPRNAVPLEEEAS